MSAAETPGDADEAALELVEAVRAGGAETVNITALGERFGLATCDVEDCLAALEALDLAIGEDLPEALCDPLPELPEGFELVDELGRGGMGVVYRARQSALDRDVAIKVLCPGQRVFGEMLRRFRDEARHLARLRHPNIVAIHEVGEVGGNVYFTMDYIAGEALSEQVKRGPMTPTQAVGIIRQVAAAVAYSHSRGILHRDLKPSNVLVDEQGTAYVVDFGVARNTQLDGQQTQTGQLLGTPAYMAPEQASGARQAIGETTDVYALGATLYECLAGRPPFGKRPLLELIAAVASEDPPPLRRLAPSVPEPLATIVHKALEKDPARRYPTVVAMREDLERFVEGKPLVARRPSLGYRLRRWLTARRPQLGSALATATLLLAAAWLAWPSVHAVLQLRAADLLGRRGHLEAAAALCEQALWRDGDPMEEGLLANQLAERALYARWGAANRRATESTSAEAADEVRGAYRNAEMHLGWLRMQGAIQRPTVEAFYRDRLIHQRARGDADALAAGLRDLRAAGVDPETSLLEAVRYHHLTTHRPLARTLSRMLVEGQRAGSLRAVLRALEEERVEELLLGALLDPAAQAALLRALVADHTLLPRLLELAGEGDALVDEAQLPALREAALRALIELTPLPLAVPSRVPSAALRERALALAAPLVALEAGPRLRGAVRAAVAGEAPPGWLAEQLGLESEDWAAWWAEQERRQAGPPQWLAAALGVEPGSFERQLGRLLAARPDAAQATRWHQLLALLAPELPAPDLALATPARVADAWLTTALASGRRPLAPGLVPLSKLRGRIEVLALDTLEPIALSEVAGPLDEGGLELETPFYVSTIQWGSAIGLPLPGLRNRSYSTPLPTLRHRLELGWRDGAPIARLIDQTARWQAAGARCEVALGKPLMALVNIAEPRPERWSRARFALVLAVIESADEPEPDGLAGWRQRIAAALDSDCRSEQLQAARAALWLGLPDHGEALERAADSADPETLACLRMARWQLRPEGALPKAVKGWASPVGLVSFGEPRLWDARWYDQQASQLLRARAAARGAGSQRAKLLAELEDQRLGEQAALTLFEVLEGAEAAALQQRLLSQPESEDHPIREARERRWRWLFVALVVWLLALCCWRRRRPRAAAWLLVIGSLPTTQLIRIGQLAESLPLPVDGIAAVIGVLLLARELRGGWLRWLPVAAWSLHLLVGQLLELGWLAPAHWQGLPTALALAATPALFARMSWLRWFASALLWAGLLGFAAALASGWASSGYAGAQALSLLHAGWVLGWLGVAALLLADPPRAEVATPLG